jgi:hypothetical protein
MIFGILLIIFVIFMPASSPAKQAQSIIRQILSRNWRKLAREQREERARRTTGERK